MSTSPGLLVKTYLQKLSEIIVWINKTVINKGNWFFDPLKIIMIKPIANEKKIIPIISERPATAWLKKPILFIANSSVKIIKFNE